MISINTINFKTESLKDYARLLLNNGFRIFVYNKDNYKVSWLIIEKNNNIGYVQLSDFGGFEFSTVHKPNIKTGTGYMLNHDISWNPTIENALKTFVKYPEWAKNKDIDSIIKYSSIDEFLKLKHILKYIEVKL